MSALQFQKVQSGANTYTDFLGKNLIIMKLKNENDNEIEHPPGKMEFLFHCVVSALVTHPFGQADLLL